MSDNVEPAGFDMRNALPATDIIFPDLPSDTAAPNLRAKSWGGMIVADRLAGMSRMLPRPGYIADFVRFRCGQYFHGYDDGINGTLNPMHRDAIY